MVVGGDDHHHDHGCDLGLPQNDDDDYDGCDHHAEC